MLLDNLTNSRARSRDGLANMLKILTNQRRGIKICHINAQSLRNKIDEFRFIFEDSGIDIICVSETWFRPEYTDLSLSLSGYSIRRVDRNGYGGVAVYVRKGISARVVSKSTDISADGGIDTPANLIEYLLLEISCDGRKLLLGCIYRPNNRICFERFLHTIQAFAVAYEDVVITGDFNSNILVDSYLIDNLRSLGLYTPNTSNATHFTMTSSTLLDLFFVSDLSKILLYDQLSAPCFSRHDLIFMTYNFNLYVPPRVITYRDFANVDYGILEREYCEIDWGMIYNIVSVDDQISFLQHSVNRLYDLAVPLRTKTLDRHSKPWFSQEIKRAICHRDLLYSRWKRFRTPEMLESYRISRKMTNRLIRRAKFEFFTAKFSTATDSRRKWRVIREIGIGRSTINEPCDIDVNTLNRQFLDIPVVSPTSNYYCFSNDSSDNKFYFTNVTRHDVLSTLLSIKSNAIGVDGIDPKFLKILIPHLVPVITYIFNKIFTTGCYPKIWKLARVIPVRKPNSEYRPIAILPFLSKVFERLVHNQVTRYLENNNILSGCQSGFRKEHSCVTALVDVSEDIRQQVDCGNVTFLVLLDHSKAFDTVDHSILCNKLQYFFNFSSTSTDLVFSYLTGRHQFVESGASKSAFLPLSRGVPQGSILGPLLFSLYINDLPSKLRYCKVRMYADDVQLYISCNIASIDRCVRSLNEELSRVFLWATANGLGINPTKSKCLIIKKNSLKLDYNPALILNSQPIEIVDSAKNLGIYFNSTLTWSNHINFACGRVFSMLRNLWQSRNCTTINIRILLAKTYLMPTLLYGCEIFASCDSISRRKLNVTFNNIVRYVYGLRRYDHVSLYVNKLYGMCLDDYLKVRILILMHRIIYTGRPDYLFVRLNFSTLNRGRRLLCFRYTSLISKYQFFIYAISLWNDIPHSSQIISNAHQFRRSIIGKFLS